MNKLTALALLSSLAVAGTLLASAAPNRKPEPQALANGYYLPKGFKLTPFLSKTPVRSFKDYEVNIKDNIDYRAVIETDVGRMVLDLYENETPTTINSFTWLARHHYYDGIAFHRVVEGFVVQGGDPNTLKPDSRLWGQGGPGYQFGLEIRKNLKFDTKGVIGMARTQDPNSNGSQFYITLAPTPSLDGQYTVFGKVLEGLTVLDKAVRGEPPAKPTRMKRVYIVEKKK